MSPVGRSRASGPDDGGYGLIELMVAGALFLVVMSIALTSVTNIADSGRRLRTDHSLNEEARNSLNRMAREIRQAEALTFAVNPDGTYDPMRLTALSLEADFNGDGCTGNACAGTDLMNNPESLTYCFDPTASGVDKTYLWLIPAKLTAVPSTCQLAGALPILAGSVAGFKVEYRSNEYRYDLAPTDGITTWQELDDAPTPVGDPGGSDGNINTSALAAVNAIVIDLTMRADGRTQSYRTQIDVRNK
jgi:type II secretory pathway pseudopilin PulG